MTMVIDISEEDYAETMYRKQYSPREMDWIDRVIANGIPLPKGHGRIVDISKIEYLKALHDAKYGKISWSEAIERIKNSAPTIIEADTEESNTDNKSDDELYADAIDAFKVYATSRK